MKDLILASQSPRRKELLSLYTTDFTVCVSDFDEDAVTADTPARLVEQLARGKCLAVAKEHPGAVVLGCDTVVDVNGDKARIRYVRPDEREADVKTLYTLDLSLH